MTSETERDAERVQTLTPEQRKLLERRIEQRRRNAAVDRIPLRADRKTAPQTLDQQYVWFVSELSPESCAYNVNTVMCLSGELDLSAFERSVREVVRRHESLRTTFEVGGEQPIQIIHDPDELPAAFNFEDHSDLPETDLERRVDARVNELANAPMDLKHGPLVRVNLLKKGHQEYVLLITIHHIVIDNIALAMFERELAALYAAYVSEAPSPLPELSIQYGDFAAWQRGHLQGARMEKLASFWSRQLEGAPLTLDLATDRARPPVQSFRGRQHTFRLSGELQQRLKAVADGNRVTAFMLYMAAFGVLLHHYSRQESVLIGTPFANRDRPETQNLIGYLLNLLPIRVDLVGDPSFEELLSRVRDVTVGAMAHHEMPFGELAQHLQLPRDLSRNPIVQTSFIYLELKGGDIEFPGMTVRPWPAEYRGSRFDLSLVLFAAQSWITAIFEYSTDLFDPETMGRMEEHLVLLLEEMASDPSRRVSEMSLLSEVERHQILVEWNDTATAYPDDVCVHELFEAQVERTPDALAVVFGDEVLTYDQLNLRANQVAHTLRDMGVRVEDLVGLCVERSLEMVVGLLGILKAGGAYVPLDPAYPRQRLEQVLTDSGTSVVLVPHDLATVLPAGPWKAIRIDADVAAADGRSDRNPSRGVAPDNLAYVIYTSGSTGRPKGVLGTLRGIVNRCAWMWNAKPFGPDEVCCQKTTLSFVDSVWEIFGPLLQGTPLVIIPDDMVRDPELFVESLARNRVTRIVLVPSLLRAILDRYEDVGARLPDLRFWVSSGEALPAELCHRFHRSSPGATLLNLYGSSEVAADATSFDTRGLGASVLHVPVGRPMANTQAYILDARLEPLPIGVPGELYIGGVQVGRGYLGQPALTAERFVPDPFGGQPGARLYRTGDLARYRPDGNIEFIGRVDHQVKLRGYRIELGEIEAVLGQHEQIREAVVLCRSDAPGEKRLVAYVVSNAGGAEASRRELREYLKGKLPGYMVPSAFVFLDALPLTPNGKVDRAALPAPGKERQAEETYVAPGTPAEQALARIWSELLRVDRVGVHDNFFRLGGDSILSIQMIARAREAGLHLKARQIFQHQTVGELAAVAETEAAGRSVMVEQAPVVGEVPLTPIQHWFFEQELTDAHHFNQSTLVSVRERLAGSVVEQAVKALLAHHDALRLRFERSEAGWQQVNAEPGGAVPFECVDLSGLGEDEQSAAITAKAEALQASLDLGGGPLMRVALFDLGGDRPDRLLIVIHHLAVDGVSWRILLEDLQRACEQVICGEEVQLPAKTTSYRQWSERLAGHADSEEVRAELEWWGEQPWEQAGEIPVQGNVAANTVGHSAHHVVQLSREETETLLRTVPIAYRTQIDDVLLTALALAFAPWTGCPRLPVDLEGHGREAPFDDVDLSRTIGWFTTIFPVILDVGARDGSVLALGASLKAVKEQLRSIPQGGLGYGLLRYLSKDSSVVEQLAGLPEAQVVFSYLGQFDQMVDERSMFGRAGESMGAGHSSRGRRAHLIHVSGVVAGGRLRLSFLWGSALHDEREIEALAERYRAALVGLISHCAAPESGGCTPSDFPLATVDQRTLDELVAEHGPRAIENLYPLSPMQLGMMYHSVSEPTAGVYVEQMRFRVDGLDVATFKRSWEEVVARHTVMRTSIVGVGSEAPLQLVHRRVQLPVTELDLRVMTENEQEAWLERFLGEDQVHGFDLAHPPLMRLSIIRRGEERYEFVWTIHHILLDGWSFHRVINEVFAIYGARRRNEDAALPRLPPFGEYIAWLQAQDAEEARSFWQRTLGGFATPTRLGETLGKIDARRTTEHYDYEPRSVPAELTESLQRLASRHRVTMNTLVAGAWSLLLSRYSGESDVVFGTIVSGRPADLEGVESMVGMFLNTLPLRVRIPDDQVLGEWLQDLQAHQSELRQYEYSPLWQVQREADLPAGTPLFDSLYTFQNFPVDVSAVRESDLKVTPIPHMERTGYPLMLTATLRPHLWFTLTYDCDRFEVEAIRRLLDHLQTLLEGMADAPEARVGTVPLLGADERQRILVVWNDTSATYPVPGCLHEMFERQVERSPDRVALTCEGEQLTYAELNRKANQVAHRLRALGVGPDHLVGLSLDRGLDLVVGILGVLKAGGGYVPLDLANPRERIAFILEDSKVRVLLTESSQLDKLPDHDAVVLCLDTDTAAIARESDHDPASGVHTDNVAYVIYTSGSTGMPKGVLVEHGTVARLFTATEHWYGFDADDVWTLFHSFAFDFSVWEMWGALLYGGRLVVVPYWISRSPEDFYKLLDRERVTVLNQTPSAFRQLIATDAEHGADRTLALRYVIFGGEALELQSLRPWFDRHGDERPQLVNMYGITETTVHVTYRPITRRDLDEAPGSVIGRPIPDLQIYILDEHRQPVPIGVPGEMYVGGAGVARGYLDRPELTAERFVPDPFRAEADARLYRTGDVARYLPDGDLEYLGRNDEQVKVRGFRIELGEVETSLNSHPWVRESVVMVRDDDADGNRRLIGYLVPDQEGASEEADALVGQWQSLYDSTYGRQADEADPTFNIIGWNSSYTGEPIPPAEMRDWVTETVERIRRGNPKRVLEIGCGTGLLLFRLVPHCEAYRGLDFSPVALDHIRGHLDCLGDAASRVDLLCRSADDLEGIEREAYDVVVINSVIQYFPSIHYLLDVLTAAVERTAPGGRVYVGDVRNLRLLEAYHASVQLHQAPEDQSVDDLRHHVRQRLVQEEELVVDPAFFIALAQHLPRVTDVRIEPKRGPAQNELTKFRYEATLIIDGDAGAVDGTWLDWTSDDVTLDALRRRLDEGPGVTLGVRGVPNARTAMDLAAADVLLHGTRNGTVGELRETLARDVNGAGFDPSDLLTLGDAGAHAPAVGWSNRSEGGAFDVLYTPRDDDDRAAPFATPRLEPRPWSHYANHPLQAKMTRQLAPRLRESLERTLPGYMIPSAFVMLESLPLTANGKVDRRALPEPEWYLSQRRGAFIAPRTPTESTLADVWSELLGIEDVGVEDDFFDLGGHSILATQVVSRAREAFGVELEVRQLFDTPTIATLAEALDAVAWAAEGRGAASLERIPRDGLLPLSFGQQRLWFVEQISPGNVAYNVPARMRLRGALDADAFQRAIDAVVARHETLRASFPTRDGEPHVVIAPTLAIDVTPQSLESLPAEDRLSTAKRLTHESAVRPFDLGKGPLLRVELYRLGPDDHVLHVSMHHVISDGWSLGIFFRELSDLYAYETSVDRATAPAPLADLPVHYVDYAQWQRERLDGEGRGVAYWRETLGGGLPTLDVPTDRPRPSTPSHRGAYEWKPIAADVYEGVQRLCQRERATPFQVLFAAFVALLARTTGQDDIVVGTPVAGRSRRELEGVIGFFVNTVVLRTDASGDPTFLALLDRVRPTVLEAFRHQDVPFERIVDEVQPERDLSRNPLFQVLFNHYNLEQNTRTIGPLEIQNMDTSLDISKFDLTLHCYEDRGRLIAKLEYCTDLFQPETIARMARHFATLLRGICSEPGRAISQLPIMDADERHEVIVDWNDTAVDAVLRSIPAQFAEQARRVPDRLALLDNGEGMTYRALDERTDRLARHLRTLGVGAEDRVAILLERSSEMIVALLGVLRAGAAYAPLDPHSPADRLAYMLADSGAKVVLTEGDLADDLSVGERRIVRLDGDWTSAPVDAAPLPDVPLDTLAYVIYTSGSTGQSKGVELEHAQLASYVQGVTPRLDLPDGTRYATVSTIAADLGNTAIFPALCGGGSLLVMPERRIGDADAFAATMREHAIDCIKIVPSHLEALLGAAANPADVLPRKLLVLGGEACTWELIDRVEKLAPACAVMNHYGPTETTVGVLTHRIVPGDRDRFPIGPPVGRPLGNARAYVLEASGEPVPVGAIGELHIGGRSVARGYHERPELTAEKFVRDPFVDARHAPNARMYRTGDLARFTSSGHILFMGRRDDQVKLRGFRVELGEIQAALERHADVGAAALVVRDEGDGVKRLVAYIAPARGATPASTDVRAYLKSQLPDYMVPAAFVIIDRIPVTPNGKLDRRALPAPEPMSVQRTTEYQPPRTESEKILASIWADVLRTDAVGVHDDFFELGGDSILSIQIISRASQAGVRLTPRDLFEHPTIAGLARVASLAPAIEAEQGTVTGPVPLTPIEHRYFADEPADPHHYNHAMLLALRDPVDPDTMREAVADLLAHHDALRLRFDRAAEVWTQRLDDIGGEIPYEHVDLSDLAADTRAGALTTRADAIQASLDLAHGPLLRVAQFAMGDDAPDRLLIVVHHAAIDGVSWRILLEDLQRACERRAAGASPDLPAKTTSFRAWAEHLVEHAETDDARAELDYWREVAGAETLRLPRDHAPSEDDRAVAHVTVHRAALSEDDTRALLQDVPKAYRTQINDTLLTALATTIGSWTDAASVRLDLEGHGREDLFPTVDLSRTVGWFTAVYPVRLDVPSASDPGAALKSIKEQLRAIPRRGIGWGILRYLADDVTLGDAAPGEITFNYLGQFDQMFDDAAFFDRAPEPAGLPVSPRNRRHSLIDVTASVSGGRLQVNWVYSRKIHDGATIERLAARFLDELRTLIAHCTTPGAGGATPSDFPLAEVTQVELDRIVARYGADSIEDVAILSPVQEGMIYHTLSEPESAEYVTQMAFTLVGDVDPAALRKAWQRVTDAHAALRTAIVTGGARRLHQVVCRQADVRWSGDDWRDTDASTMDERLAAAAIEERRADLDLATPPLMRFRIIRTGDDRYRLIWTHHHVLLDGWSLPLLMRDVFQTYAAEREGRPIPVEPGRPFFDYIRWLAAQDRDVAEAYWRERLAGWHEPTPLPVRNDAARTRHEPASGSIRASALPAEATDALHAFARHHHLTLNTVVLGAWALLLSRYSGERDVLFGATVSGRPADLVDVERILGMFINTLPMRIAIEDDRLVPWLAGIQSQQLELQRFVYSALYEIQPLVGAAGHSRLFDSIFVFENFPTAVRTSGRSTGVLRIEDPQDVSFSNYPLAAVVRPGAQLAIELRYDQRFFDDDTIERMLAHLVALLESMAARPDARLDDVAMLTDVDRRRMLHEWNDTTRPYPRDASVPALFRAQAARTPDAVAVTYGVDEITYAALDERSDRLANHLHAQGITRGDLVAVCVERGVDLIVAMLGVLKAGAAYVPLDPAHPTSRLALMLEDTHARALLTHAALRDDLPDVSCPVVLLDRDGPAIAAAEATAAPVESAADDLAYVIYTSGSTGRPKGVCVPHRAIARLVLGTDYVQLGPDDRVAQAANASFDAATFEIWGGLLTGARVVGLDADTTLAPRRFADAIRERGITVLFITTALFNQLEADVPDIFAPLRCLLFGGEAVDPQRVRAVLENGPPQRLLHVYGPTENTTFSTWHEVTDVPAGARTVPIGRPIANSTMYVLDAAGGLVPAGAPGELYVGGDGLAVGYLNEPELTAARFVPHPFVPGERLYRTGDLVRLRDDGSIDFVGRVDHQVKLRGFRIELGEIETALLQETGVRDAVVLCREDEPGEKRLIAYVVPETAETLATGDLRSGLRERLPDYMMPTAVVILESMPINRNGKIDRSALPEPDRAETAATGFVAPGTPAEQTLAAIWSEVLRVERIGIHDNFFDLGGHSLLATQVISRVRVAFQQEIPLQALFDSPTVGELAAVIEGASGEALAAPPIVPVAREDDLPLSFAQQRLWFLEQLRPGEVAYHSSLTIRLRGTLDIDALGRSLDELVRRHETLRTTFRSVDGMPRQVIGQPSCVELELVDLTPLPEGERELEARRLAVEGVNRPFDLSRDPLMRTRLLRLGEREHVLYVVMHHIVTDGWSMGVLKRELGALYAAFVRGDAPPLAALEVQYADFSAWQRSWMSGEVLERQLDYWRGKLGGVGQLELPTDRPRPANQTFGAAHVEHVLPADLWYELEALSQREAATPFMTLLGAFGVLLQRYARQDDITVGSPIANRNRVETEGLIGFFVNTLVMRIDLSGSPTFRELLSLARSAALGAYQHQDVPFEKLVEELQPERDPSRNPLFQVMFAVQNAPGDELDLPALEIGRFDLGMGSTRFDLELHVWEAAQGPTARFIYNTDLFDAGTIERMARHYRRLLDAIVADPDRRIADLPMLDDAERGLIVETWNVTATDYPRDACIHELFEAQAAQTPNAIALEFAGETLTYDALNRRANQVARHLIGLGVGPEVKVGICVERSLEMVVGILGILKAGGAYVPLDPGYPAERLSFMMRDTNAPVVLTLSRYEPELPKYDGTVLRLDADWPVFAAEPETNPAVAGTTATSLAYVIYTSGSTGRPKGVCVPHRAISRLVLETDYVALGPSDRMAHVSNVSFDAATFEIWGALLNGGTLVAVERDVALAPDRLAAALRDQRISVIFITTALFNQLAEFDGIFSSVRCVLFGGEAVDPARVRAVLAHGAPERLLHVYGPTENTTFSTWSEVRAVTPEATTVPIGRPIANTTAYVLDAYMNPVPIGVPGELYLGGDGLAHGYLDRAELTAARFVADPFSRIAGSRLYRTGDLVQYRADGDLEFVGRVDHQVKLRGFRIELGEIETALLQETGVRDAVVLCREDTPGDKRLVAYVTGENGESLSPAALRSGLGASLPDYMIPSGFVPMDQLPLTVNGKIDRAALPAPDGSHAPSLAYVEPSTETERTLAAIWGDVLHQDRVGIHDDFFYDLGGHSLVATRVVSRVRERFGLSLSLASIFDNPTVAGLAGLIDAEHREEIEL